MSEKIRLLFVEDEEDFVGYMSKRLAKHELEIHEYTNPIQALEGTEGQTFDVALLDLKMPEMNGEELLIRLKQRDPSIEIIILTGHGNIESAFRSAKQGAYEYLLKPCDFDALVSSINNAYAKRIKAISQDRAAQVDELMKKSGQMSPLKLLSKLKSIHHRVERSMTAAAMAEGGALDAAQEVMDKKPEK